MIATYSMGSLCHHTTFETTFDDADTEFFGIMFNSVHIACMYLSWKIDIYSVRLFIFQPSQLSFLPFSSNLKLSSANSSSFEGSKICRFGKG